MLVKERSLMANFPAVWASRVDWELAGYMVDYWPHFCPYQVTSGFYQAQASLKLTIGSFLTGS